LILFALSFSSSLLVFQPDPLHITLMHSWPGNGPDPLHITLMHSWPGNEARSFTHHANA